MGAIAEFSSVPALVLLCGLRECVVIGTRPFQSSSQLAVNTDGASGAVSGWRECLKALSTGIASFLVGYLSAIGDYRLPFYVASAGMLLQAAVYWRHGAHLKVKRT